MKILQVCPIFPPQPKNVGSGVTQVVYNISGELIRQGHKVEIYTSDALDAEQRIGNKDNSLIIDGIKVNYFHYIMHYYTFSLTPSIISTVRRQLKEFDSIHIHDFRSFQGIIVAHYARKFNIPYLIQAHGSLPKTSHSKLRSMLNFILDLTLGYRVLRGASKAIALNRMEADQYRAIGIPNEKIVVVPNGINLSEYAVLPPKGSFRKKFNIQDYLKIVLYIGRLHKAKGIDLLINSFAYLNKTMGFDDILLVIAGPDDGYLAEAKFLAYSLGISNSVLFTGFVDSEDKLGALVDAHLFATPSFYGFPMTFLEACAVGTPIITTTLGDELEWIDGKVGCVTPPTKSDFAEAIGNTITNDEIRSKFSENCRKLVESDFSIESVVDRLGRVYSEVSKSKKDASRIKY